MIRHLVIFAVTFAVGALAAVVLRTALHRPYERPAAPPPAAAGDHPGHAATAAPPRAEPAAPPATAGAEAPVNTVCPICGMPVDARLGTIAYKGRPVGFGCKACPPKFRAEPEKYGEAALANRVVE